MKVMFVGGLWNDRPDFKCISANISALVQTMAKHSVHFVLRHSRADDGTYVPIDYLVYASLSEHAAKEPGSVNANTLTIVREPGAEHSSNLSLPHTSFSATTATRVDFYRELLDQVDFVIGAGGQHGLLRLAIVCEYSRKPIFFLPGTGGTADMLWTDYLRKSVYVSLLPRDVVGRVQATPFANVLNQRYAETSFDIIHRTYSVLSASLVRTDVYTLDGVSLVEISRTLRHLSVGSWLTVSSLLAALTSAAYYFGTINILKKVFGTP